MDTEERTRQRAEVEKQIVAIQSRIEMSPPLEQRYAALLRDPIWPSRITRIWSSAANFPTPRRTWRAQRPAKTSKCWTRRRCPSPPRSRTVWPSRVSGTVLGLFGRYSAGGWEGSEEHVPQESQRTFGRIANLPVLSSIPLLEHALLVRRKRRLFLAAWSSAIIIGSIAMSGSAYYYYFGHTLGTDGAARHWREHESSTRCLRRAEMGDLRPDQGPVATARAPETGDPDAGVSSGERPRPRFRQSG